jgi:hypothetical protein
VCLGEPLADGDESAGLGRRNGPSRTSPAARRCRFGEKFGRRSDGENGISIKSLSKFSEGALG